MAFLEFLFTPQLLFGATFAACVLFAGRSLVKLIAQGRELHLHLAQLEAALNALIAGLPERQALIAALKRQIQPLEVELRELRLYYAQLKRIEEQADREQAAQEEKSEEEDAIRQQRRGLEEFL